MLRSQIGPISIVDFNHMEIISRPRAQKNHWDGKLWDCFSEPGAIIADLWRCPDNPLHLA
jgi:hypothetical protein